MQVVNLAEKFAKFKERWSPKIAGQINDFYVKLVKIEGEFVWHSHEHEAELFLVLVGELRMRFRAWPTQLRFESRAVSTTRGGRLRFEPSAPLSAP